MGNIYKAVCLFPSHEVTEGQRQGRRLKFPAFSSKGPQVEFPGQYSRGCLVYLEGLLCHSKVRNHEREQTTWRFRLFLPSARSFQKAPLLL